MIADADGGNAASYGNKFPWASWGPDGKQIACLDKKGIQIIDLASRRVVRQIPRNGIVQQLVWSPDGKRFTGTANGLGVAWTVGCLDAETGRIRPVSEVDRYNCTPDWLPDSEHIIYSRGIVPGKAGWAQLWLAKADGTERQLLYAEDKQHCTAAASRRTANTFCSRGARWISAKWTTPARGWRSSAARTRPWSAATTCL